MIEEKTGAMGWTRVRYQLGNHLGTVALEVDEDSEMISYEAYHPYGTTAWKAPELTEVSAKRYRYTGMKRDEETGLQRHGVRYYAVWLSSISPYDPNAVIYAKILFGVFQ